MSIKDGEFEFKLTRPLGYKFDGQSHEASHIVLREPSMEHVKFYLRLKQMLQRAQLELAQKAGKVQENIGEIVRPITEQAQQIEDDADQILELFKVSLETSDSVDIGQFIGTFESMACARAKRSVCMIDGRLAMNDALWQGLKPEDAYCMALRWCSFFGMPSKEGSKTTSGQQSESPTGPMEV